MRFWDASAVTPLLVSERWSDRIEELVRADQEIVVWWGTRLECASALRRRERDGALSSGGARQALELLGTLAAAWSEVLPTDAVRASAERALAVHPFRAADALQLAAALTWRRDHTRRLEFISLDDRLRDAAEREGFIGLPEALE
ncbi:MAG: type II toxin-antitoxin system VapC family toxin [Solirubrobacterales bacterium]